MLRTRTARREELAGDDLPDPIVTFADDGDPAEQVAIADSVGLALLVVLESLTPAERIAFVLHDMFAVPFDEIAAVVDRSPDATRQLASRARRRVQGASVPDADEQRRRQIVDAFFAAARHGEFDALVALLDPDVVLRSERGTLRGAAAVAGSALMFADPTRALHPAFVNGETGVVVTVDGVPVAVMGFTVRDGRVVAIEALGDPDRVAGLGLPRFGT
jgi:RNA polymerase sigma-70 factor (ECF subfamily)